MNTKGSEATGTPNLPNHISANLRLLRKRQGWSQSELAAKVNLNRGNIASYESGTAEPSICKLLRISNLFEVTPRDFTRRDFRLPGELELARRAQYQQANREGEELARYRDRALELSQLIASSRNLYNYQRKTAKNNCPAADSIAAQYEQLQDFTQQLLQEHRNLLTKVGCQCE